MMICVFQASVWQCRQSDPKRILVAKVGQLGGEFELVVRQEEAKEPDKMIFRVEVAVLMPSSPAMADADAVVGSRNE